MLDQKGCHLFKQFPPCTASSYAVIRVGIPEGGRPSEVQLQQLESDDLHAETEVPDLIFCQSIEQSC